MYRGILFLSRFDAPPGSGLWARSPNGHFRRLRMTAGNPLHALAGLGQSVWLDFIRRSWLEDGTIERLIAEDDLRGMTSNPAIFEKAIAQGREYDAQISGIVARGERDPLAVYEEVAVADIRQAADLLAAVYRRTHCQDGYVSLEVSPELAHDASGTLAEARRLWQEVDRPNLMIKVPGTRTCLPVIRALLAEGINAASPFAKELPLVAEAPPPGESGGCRWIASPRWQLFIAHRYADTRRSTHRAGTPSDRSPPRLCKARSRCQRRQAYSLFTGLFAPEAALPRPEPCRNVSGLDERQEPAYGTWSTSKS
jgi:hypothetical protein